MQQLKDVGFRSSKWNWTWCGLWERAWCAPEAIKAQPFQKIITLGTCLLMWSSPSPCRVSSSSPLMAKGPKAPQCHLLLCAAGAEPECPGVALSLPCSKGLEEVSLCCVPPALPQPSPAFASALVSQYWLANTELLGQLLWLPLRMETPVPGNTFPALMKCTAVCSTCKPDVGIAKQHPSVICHNYCCELCTIEMLEHKASSSTASKVFLQ